MFCPNENCSYYIYTKYIDNNIRHTLIMSLSKFVQGAADKGPTLSCAVKFIDISWVWMDKGGMTSHARNRGLFVLIRGARRAHGFRETLSGFSLQNQKQGEWNNVGKPFPEFLLLFLVKSRTKTSWNFCYRRNITFCYISAWSVTSETWRHDSFLFHSRP